MELGEKLREAREEKGLSLHEIQQMTKIQTRYLQAIEEGNYKVLPGSFYTRAFIREFAENVGLNADQLLEEYQSELPSSTDEDLERLSRVQKHRKQANSNKNSIFLSVFPKILTVLLIVSIIVFAYYFYQQTIEPEDTPQEQDSNEVEITRGEEAQEPNDELEKTDESATEDGEGEANEEDSENEGKVDEPEPESETELELVNQSEGGSLSAEYDVTLPEDEFNMTIETSKNSWLVIKNGDGKVFYNDDFSDDESPKTFDFAGEKEIQLRVGRAADLDVTINGVKVEYPFDPSKPENYVQNLTIKVKE
ncbi:helix-turn-helix domain-containing protein [Salinibacillus xinjiangensis]|nr:helix-turn-helix domain-containing protein [Salinibacillus xinjiangensis]